MTETTENLGRRAVACKPGDYVLATKYEDGDPGDHFAVGLFRDMTWHGRYNITDNEGNLTRGNGFRRAELISRDEGDWIVANLRHIEALDLPVWSLLRLFREAEALIAALEAAP